MHRNNVLYRTYTHTESDGDENEKKHYYQIYPTKYDYFGWNYTRLIRNQHTFILMLIRVYYSIEFHVQNVGKFHFFFCLKSARNLKISRICTVFGGLSLPSLAVRNRMNLNGNLWFKSRTNQTWLTAEPNNYFITQMNVI